MFQHIKRKHAYLFASVGISQKRATEDSGLSRFGWNGHIISAASSLPDVRAVQKENVHDFLKYLDYKKAEFKALNPEPK